MAIDQRNFGFFKIVRDDNTALDHLMVKVITFTGPLTHTGENRHTRVHLGNVVDQFHNQNGFANTGTTEQTNFTTFGVRGEQVDHFDACFQDHRFRGLLRKLRSVLMDATFRCLAESFALIHRLTDHVQDPAQSGTAHGNGNWTGSIGHLLTANQTFGRVHSDGTNCALAQVLGNFEHQRLAAIVCCQSVQNLRQIAIKLNVNNGADHLSDFAFCICHVVSPGFRALQRPK